MRFSEIIEFLIFGKVMPRVERCKRAAKKGDVDAQLKLGMYYYAGQHMLQDKRRAIHWFHPAASRGSATAQFYLGRTHFEGHGIYKCYESAYAWISLAVAGGCDGAKKWLDALSDEMTPEEIAEGCQLARELAERLRGGAVSTPEERLPEEISLIETVSALNAAAAPMRRRW